MAVSTPGIQHISAAPSPGLYESLNTRWHREALWGFMVIVLFHWSEHIVQAYQFFVLHWSRPMSMGLVGMYYPWLMKTEVLHYGFALVMLIDRKSTRLNSSHLGISYAVFCLKKK